jgi:hypothetical protein
MNPPDRAGARPRAERLISSARSHPRTPRDHSELDAAPPPRTTARPSLARSAAAVTDYRASIPSSQRRCCRPSRARGAFAAWGHRAHAHAGPPPRLYAGPPSPPRPHGTPSRRSPPPPSMDPRHAAPCRAPNEEPCRCSPNTHPPSHGAPPSTWM